MAGLLLLPGRLLGPDRPVHLAIPPAQGARLSVEAAPPLVIHHIRPARPKTPTATPLALQRTFVREAPAVVRVSPARRLLKAHRSAVISKLAPTAPLVRARVLAAVSVRQQPVAPKPATSTAKTIAGLAAELSKK